MKKNETTNYSGVTKNSKCKKIISAAAVVLLILLVVGMVLQVFMPNGKKPSEWFKKDVLAVGDQITTLYGNKEKTIDDVVAMLEKLDWSDDINDGSEWDIAYDKIYLCTLSSDKGPTEYHLYASRRIAGSSSDLEKPYGIFVDIKNGDVHTRIWSQLTGWQTPVDLGATYTVLAIYQQDIWQDFLSDKPFGEEPIKNEKE